MSILDASLRKTWDSLRAKKQVQDDFLHEVRLRSLRGIRNLRNLPQKDRGVSSIRGRNRDLLFAGLEHRSAVRYSEFDMSAGERAILRMSKDISGLQVVVTTHSPVMLNSVPPEGRIFLERDAATLDVRRTPAYRDIFQKALYGQSTDRLSILCEDEVAEGVIHAWRQAGAR